ncbi:hypothetical protein IFM89_036450 [Coptis chinensis]|uniref:Uncharacterized protein n=1 Tax=Coptis chinensis TaxID=261450 RepID=A0A835HWM1_9MAGN|nr:hypothetical protein IFM89_036450 [Coptis chinensis]
MEEVVKTGILSRRWDHLWTKVQHICYNSPLSGKKEELEKFTCFVNNTLSFLKCDSIEEFSLDFSDLSPEVVNAGRMEGMRRFALQVDRWIHCAVTKKVKVLYLNLVDSKGPMYGFPYKVPGHIFSNDSITELLLCVCRLNPFRPI